MGSFGQTSLKWKISCKCTFKCDCYHTDLAYIVCITVNYLPPCWTGVSCLYNCIGHHADLVRVVCTAKPAFTCHQADWKLASALLHHWPPCWPEVSCLYNCTCHHAKLVWVVSTTKPAILMTWCELSLLQNVPVTIMAWYELSIQYNRTCHHADLEWIFCPMLIRCELSEQLYWRKFSVFYLPQWWPSVSCLYNCACHHADLVWVICTIVPATMLT